MACATLAGMTESFWPIYGDACRIGFAEALSQFDWPVMGIIVTDKSTNETDNDVG